MVEMQQKLGYTTNKKATHLCTIANVSISRSNTLVLLSILAEFRHELPFDILNNSVLHFHCILLKINYVIRRLALSYNIQTKSTKKVIK